MTDFFSSYFSFLFSPFAIHEGMRRKREHLPVDHFKSIESGDEFVSYSGLNLQIGILISWLFFMVQVAYTLLGLKLGVVLFEKVQEETSWDILMDATSLSSFSDNRIVIFSALLSVVFFPLVAWVYIKFWIIIVTFTDNLFFERDSEFSAKDVFSDVVVATLPSHALLVVPVIGYVLKQFFFVFLLYAGLRSNLKYNFSQSLIVLLAPILLMGFFIMAFGFLITMSINLI